MRLFDYPSRIEMIPYRWDHNLREVIDYAKGAGEEIPEPRTLTWVFNGVNVIAKSSLEMLLAGLVAWNVWAVEPFRGRALESEEDLLAAGLDWRLIPRRNQTEDEVEDFLQDVKDRLTVIQTS